MRGMDLTTAFAGVNSIPVFVFFAYQMMFAMITPALITGAFTNRVNFKAYMIFLVAGCCSCTSRWCHMVWGNGLLAKHGVLDFAGGIVVHDIAGIRRAGLGFFVGQAQGRRIAAAHSIPLVALGTGLLWFGWYGFNAGSELKVDSVTARPSSTPTWPPPSRPSPGSSWPGSSRRSPSSWAC